MLRDRYAHPPRRDDRERAGTTRRALLRFGLTPLARRDVDFASVAERVRETWDADGHEPLMRAIEPVAGVVTDLADVDPGLRVLDVGAGDGNVARACAVRGAEVTACDVSAAMVERGRARSGSAVSWERADAQDLPFADGAFDAVLSVFGATLAPDPARVAHELVRVLRPGGALALAAWVPRGLPGGLDEHIEELAPLPQGVPSPSDWGRQPLVRERLGGLLDGLELRTRSLPLRFRDADAAFGALATAAPLDAGARARLRPHFNRLLASCNDSADAVEFGARYLIALGRRARSRSRSSRADRLSA